MRVVKKETQTKEVEVVIEDYHVCDCCDKVIECEAFDAFECSFIHRTGSAYPEGGFGDKWEVELCKKCAADLTEILVSLNYRVTHSEWDS